MAKINIKNRTIFCSDNLDILEGINSDAIDLIYLDPPFNKKKVFTAPTGTTAEGASFSDIFKEEDVKSEWVLTIKEDNEKLHNFLNGIKNIDGIKSYNYCYLCYMAIRLIEMHRILKDTGSLYLHCDPTMSHSLKLVLDCIFGERNFITQIIWHYSWGVRTDKKWNRKHDVILVYSKSQNFIFNALEVMEKRQAEVLRRLKIGIKSATMAADKGKSIDKTLALPTDVWNIPTINAMSKERVGYPTQKPLTLLEKIIKASSKEGNLILDPFCGCATTCVASEKLGRQWIGIDVSKMAFQLVKERLTKEIPSEIWNNKTIHFEKTRNLKRTDGGGKYKEKKYVYILEKTSELPYYKVGIAKNIKTRLSSYQIGDKDRDYKMIYTFATTQYREIEKYIHEKFKNLHEWVEAKPEEIIKEIENYKKN
jgi:site-specific DNA-methyltransferase (adenine-specific)